MARTKTTKSKPAATETTSLVGEDPLTPGATTAIHEDTYEIHPRSKLYSVFMAISSAAVLISGLELLAQVLSLALVGGIFIEHLLRAYMITFSVMFILSELQLDWFVEMVPPFKNWIYRGFLYSFTGVIGIEQSYAILAEEYPKIPGLKGEIASIALRVSSIAMLCIGVIYMLMSVLCLKGVFEKVRAAYREQINRSDDSVSLSV